MSQKASEKYLEAIKRTLKVSTLSFEKELKRYGLYRDLEGQMEICKQRKELAYKYLALEKQIEIMLMQDNI